MDLEILKQVRQLAQFEPPNTDTFSVIQSNEKRKVVVTSVVVTNTTTAAAAYSIYLDRNGTTYSNATAIANAVSIAANTTQIIEFEHGLPVYDNRANGNLAVKSSVANTITFTINGLDISG